MNSIPKNRKHLIILGIVVLLCLSAIALFMNSRIKPRIDQISKSIAGYAYEQKATNVNYEFNKLISGLAAGTRITTNLKDGNDFLKNSGTIYSVIMNDAAVSHAWSVVLTKKDTSFHTFGRGSKEEKATTKAYVANWVKKTFSLQKQTAQSAGSLFSVSDSLHWVVASACRLKDSSLVVIGLDINLKKFQNYLWNVKDKSKAYAIIFNEQGYCISHPEIKFIGQRLLDPKKTSLAEKVLGDSATIKETIFSNYLAVPVIRSYSPLRIGPMNWIMAIDTPVFVVDDEVDDIERNVIGMGILSVLIIVGVVAYLQKKWQNEFIGREQAEANRKTLLLERQELQMVTEKQEKENALLQLKVLKDKVNPHFLFNSMGSLNALIDRDPKLAREFIVRLSKVYRYLLDSYPNGQASVKEELNFASQYWFLLNIRFGEAMLPLEIDVNHEHLKKNLPFMSLQIALENAVKHNVVSKQNPLEISIKSEGERIVVVNNYQPRSHVDDSGKQGISYLLSTYQHFGGELLTHGIYGTEYRCYFPLL